VSIAKTWRRLDKHKTAARQIVVQE